MTDSTHSPHNARSPRFLSHALVDIRPFWWNPFYTVSAILLDLSEEGFKFECTESISLRPSSRIALNIPLVPFGLRSPRHFKAQGTVRWFDPSSMRAGGTFLPLNTSQTQSLRHIIRCLAGQTGS